MTVDLLHCLPEPCVVHRTSGTSAVEFLELSTTQRLAYKENNRTEFIHATNPSLPLMA